MLDKIIAKRRQYIEKEKAAITMEELLMLAACAPARRRLSAQMKRGCKPVIIAEVKKASPSAGLIRDKYDPVEIAQAYEKAGASAVSVLTEPHFFLGEMDDLTRVKQQVHIPVLRKDFIVDEYQIAESAAYGADIILLIVAALGDKQLKDYAKMAAGLGLEVLVEAHTEHELEKALEVDDALIGINSRDLKTLKTDLAVPFRLASFIPQNRISIAESGIKTPDDVRTLFASGYKGFLVGESLLKKQDSEVLLTSFINI